jgi:hypothetical protein
MADFHNLLRKGVERIATGIDRRFQNYLFFRSKRLDKKDLCKRLEIAKSNVRGFFFISGAPKSGTSWLRMMLNHHPQIAAVQEAHFFAPQSDVHTWFCEEKFRAWTERRTVKGGSHMLNGINKDELIKYFKKSMIEAILLAQWKPHVRIIGDKSPLTYCEKAKELKHLFPNAKFINLIRDGRDVAVSMHFHWLREKNFSYYQNDEFGENARNHFVEGKNSKIELFNDCSLNFACNAWNDSINGGREAKTIFGENFYQLKYEDLLYNPLAIKYLFKFLNVSSNRFISKYCTEKTSFKRLSKGRKRGEEDPNSFFRKGISGDWKKHFNSNYKDKYKSASGELLIELGYEKDSNW